MALADVDARARFVTSAACRRSQSRSLIQVPGPDPDPEFRPRVQAQSPGPESRPRVQAQSPGPESRPRVQAQSPGPESRATIRALKRIQAEITATLPPSRAGGEPTATPADVARFAKPAKCTAAASGFSYPRPLSPSAVSIATWMDPSGHPHVIAVMAHGGGVDDQAWRRAVVPDGADVAMLPPSRSRPRVRQNSLICSGRSARNLRARRIRASSLVSCCIRRAYHRLRLGWPNTAAPDARRRPTRGADGVSGDRCLDPPTPSIAPARLIIIPPC
jgi:hypothetical protein